MILEKLPEEKIKKFSFVLECWDLCTGIGNSRI